MTWYSHSVALAPSCTTSTVKICFNAGISDNLRACPVLVPWLWSWSHLGCAGGDVQAAGQHAEKQDTGPFFAGYFAPCTFCWVHAKHWDDIWAFGVSVLLVWYTFHRTGERLNHKKHPINKPTVHQNCAPTILSAVSALCNAFHRLGACARSVYEPPQPSQTDAEGFGNKYFVKSA